MKKLQTHLDDLSLLLGATSITIGVAQIYPPAAWIVFGVLAIVWGVIYAKSMQPLEEIIEPEQPNEADE